MKVIEVMVTDMIKNGGILVMPDALKKLSKIEKAATYNAKCSHEIWIYPPKNLFTFSPTDSNWMESKQIDEKININFRHPSLEE